MYLETGVEDRYEVTIHSEINLGNTTVKTRVPCFVSHDVQKEKGYVAISPRTSVELIETEARGVTRVDARELSADMCALAGGRSIVLAYKYLNPSFDLHVHIIRHEDSSVLTCIVDKAIFTVTYSSGVFMHSLKLHVRNTSRQFLRVFLPYSPKKQEGDKKENKEGEGEVDTESVSVWSASVAGQPVKPALDDKHRLLIPISSLASSSSSSSESCPIQVVFIQHVTPIDEHQSCGAEFGIRLAACDAPIEQLTCRVFLPDGIKFVPYPRGEMKVVAGAAVRGLLDREEEEETDGRERRAVRRQMIPMQAQGQPMMQTQMASQVRHPLLLYFFCRF